MNIVAIILSVFVSMAFGLLCVLYLGTAKLLLPLFLEFILFLFNYKYNKRFKDNQLKWLIIFWFTFVPFFIVPIVLFIMSFFGLIFAF